uniref:SH3 domain-binding glutamic acid-rich-like protein 1 n=1 Tax=Phasianus colchicus TaxID=9054 RepID=A0A669PI97_PHACC
MVIISFLVVKSCRGRIKKQQQDVLGFLEANKIEFEEKDIAANEENRKWMRENVPEDRRPASGNPLPPRLFNDSRYLGDYEAFFEARENNAVYAFLGLTAPPGSKVGVYIYHNLYFIPCSFLLMAGYFTCSEGVTVNLHTGLIFTVSTGWLSDFNITTTHCHYVLLY